MEIDKGPTTKRAADMRSLSYVWGKLARDEDGQLVSSQSLTGHSLDVAAVFQALLDVPGLSSRLARLAGRPGQCLLPVDVSRLCWLVFLHDFGKVNSGFQARRDKGAENIGHIAPISAIFGCDPFNRKLEEAAATALGLRRLDTWGDGTIDLFHAVLSHHGKPWPAESDRNTQARYARYWSSRNGYDPMIALEALRLRADQIYGGGFEEGAPVLPGSSRFVHAFAGLVQLADWIGSSDWESRANLDTGLDRRAWAAQRLGEIGISTATAHRQLLSSNVTFETAFGFSPRAPQAAFVSVSGSLAILESETGSGKTEAALWRFVERFRAGAVDGLFFALPTRTAAVQLFHRVEHLARKLWPQELPPVVLAVPGYLDDDQVGAIPPAADVFDEAEQDSRVPAPWASEHPKRFFAAAISVGTIDQAFLSVLRVKHAHLRSALLMRHMLVVDEVHASDSYMRRLLESLLRDHLAAGGEAALLSATLGAEARAKLMHVARLIHMASESSGQDAEKPGLTQAIATPYPLMTTLDGERAIPVGYKARVKTVAIEAVLEIDDPAAIAARALEAAQAGAKVLIVRNTVDGAVAVAEALTQAAGADRQLLFQVNGIAALHHGRFAREDRKLLDAAVEAALGKTRPVGGLVLVGTQTLEQSLDIDADLLITDLCPADVLLQRLGRLHRHDQDADGAPRYRPSGFETPRGLVLVPNRPLSHYLPGGSLGQVKRNGLGPRMENGVPRGAYPNLLVLEATRRLIKDYPVWIIPAMNRQLVECAIHSEALEALIASFDSAERDAWRAHSSAISGGAHGDRLTAALGCLDRNKPFMDRENAINSDERIATRLGDQGLLVDLPTETLGPFGTRITRLVIPAWMVRQGDAPTTVQPATSGELAIEAGGNSFIYNVLGLQIRRV